MRNQGVVGLIMVAVLSVAGVETHAQTLRLIDIFSPGPEGGPQEVKAFLQKIEAAIDSGADLDAPDEYGNTPLLTATYWSAISYHDWGANDVVAYLLQRGANPNVQHKKFQNQTPLHLAAISLWPNTRLVEMLCAAGANPNAKPEPAKISPLELSQESKFPRLSQAMSKCAEE